MGTSGNGVCRVSRSKLFSGDKLKGEKFSITCQQLDHKMASYVTWAIRQIYASTKRRSKSVNKGAVRRGMQLRLQFLPVVSHCENEIHNPSSMTFAIEMLRLADYGLRMHLSQVTGFRKLKQKGGDRNNPRNRSGTNQTVNVQETALTLKVATTRPPSIHFVQEAARLFIESTQRLLSQITDAHVNKLDLLRMCVATLVAFGISWNTYFGGPHQSCLHGYKLYVCWCNECIRCLEKRKYVRKSELPKMYIAEDKIDPSLVDLKLFIAKNGYALTRFNSEFQHRVKCAMNPFKQIDDYDKLERMAMHVACQVGSGLSAREDVLCRSDTLGAMLTPIGEKLKGAMAFGTCFTPTLDSLSVLEGIQTFLQSKNAVSESSELRHAGNPDRFFCGSVNAECVGVGGSKTIQFLIHEIASTNHVETQEQLWKYLDKFGVGQNPLNDRERQKRVDHCQTQPAPIYSFEPCAHTSSVSSEAIDQITVVVAHLWKRLFEIDPSSFSSKPDKMCKRQAGAAILTALMTMGTIEDSPDIIAAIPTPVYGSSYEHAMTRVCMSENTAR